VRRESEKRERGGEREREREEKRREERGRTELFLGGLLSAFALSKDPFYLERATSLGELLVVGFEKTPSGFPESVLNLKTKASHNHAWNGLCLLSEVGSSQIEYAYLSHHTKDPSFYKKSRQVYTSLDRLPKQLPG